MNKFNYSSKTMGKFDDGTVDLYVNSLRIRNLDPSLHIQTDSVNRVISVQDVTTSDQIHFKPDSFTGYSTLNFANGIKSSDVTISESNYRRVSKSSNNLKSYAYAEAQIWPSHQDVELLIQK